MRQNTPISLPRQRRFVSAAEALETLDPGRNPARSIYVHVPFCFHKCHYCDFYSITRQDWERMERYVDRVLKEGEFWKDAPCKIAPETIFFGGGTPSLLPVEAMRRLIVGLKDRFDYSAVEEWTVEINPATA